MSIVDYTLTQKYAKVLHQYISDKSSPLSVATSCRENGDLSIRINESVNVWFITIFKEFLISIDNVLGVGTYLYVIPYRELLRINKILKGKNNANRQ